MLSFEELSWSWYLFKAIETLTLTTTTKKGKCNVSTYIQTPIYLIPELGNSEVYKHLESICQCVSDTLMGTELKYVTTLLNFFYYIFSTNHEETKKETLRIVTDSDTDNRS